MSFVFLSLTLIANSMFTPDYKEKNSTNYRTPESCYFCQDHGDKIQEIQERLIYEGKFVRVIADRSQSMTDSFINKSTNHPLIAHLLLTTKRHVQSIADVQPEEHAEMLEVMQKAKRVFKAIYTDLYRPEEEQYEVDSMMVILRDGPAAGQKVHHLHYHLLAARNRSLEEKELDKTAYINGEYDPVQEIARRRGMTNKAILLKEVQLLQKVWQNTN